MAEDNKCLKVFLIALVGIGLFISPFLIGFSFRKVNYDEYGLLQNTFSKNIEPEVYTAGKHYVGLTSKFILFKRIVQYITPSVIYGRSSDSQDIRLYITIAFRLDPNYLFDVYKLYKDQYTKSWTDKLSSVFSNVADDYSSQDFLKDGKRAEIEAAFKRAATENIFNARYNNQSQLIQGGGIVMECILNKVELGTSGTSNVETQILDAQKSQLDEQKASVQAELNEITQNTTQSVRDITGQGLNEIAAMQSQYNLNESIIVSTATQLLAEADANVTATYTEGNNTYNLFVYRVNSMKANLSAETARYKAETDQILKSVEEEIDTEKTMSEIRINAIKAAAEVDVINLQEQAKADAKNLEFDATIEAYTNWQTELSLSPVDFNTYEYTQLFASRDADDVLMDLYRPSVLNIDAAQEDTLHKSLQSGRAY